MFFRWRVKHKFETKADVLQFISTSSKLINSVATSVPNIGNLKLENLQNTSRYVIKTFDTNGNVSIPDLAGSKLVLFRISYTENYLAYSRSSLKEYIFNMVHIKIPTSFFAKKIVTEKS